MTLIAVLIVLGLEHYFKIGAEYRSFRWFELMHEKLEEKLEQQSFWNGWAGVAIVLLLPVAALWLFINIFPAPLNLLFLFLFACLVLFLCLGPKPLKASLTNYFEALDRGDNEAAFLALQQEMSCEEIPEGEDFKRNATRLILVESQTRYFGVIFWFLFLGPFGALFYRLAHLYYAACKQDANDEHLQLLTRLLHFLDWAPARVTSMLFLLTGDFVNGFYRVKDYLFDLDASNYQLISETGVAAMGIDIGMTDAYPDENQNALSIVDRTLIIYIVVVALLTPLTIW